MAPSRKRPPHSLSPPVKTLFRIRKRTCKCMSTMYATVCICIYGHYTAVFKGRIPQNRE